MRKAERLDVERYRRLKAIAVVLAIVVAAPGASAVARFLATPQEAAAANAAEPGIRASRLVNAGDVFGSLERIEEAAQVAGAGPPEAFARELGLPSGAYDVRVSQTGEVVGYSLPGTCADVLGSESRRLESLGWSPVSLNGEEGATFVKRSGECNWALMTCTQAGDSVSVVVRWVRSWER